MECRDAGITRMLRERGLRPTKARCLILELLAERDDHPSTDELLRVLRKRGRNLGPATLYQNLNKLADEGLIIRFTGPDRLVRYDGNLAHHHHLVCIRCGRMIDVQVDESSVRTMRPACFRTDRPLSDWPIEGAQVEFKATCPACRAKG